MPRPRHACSTEVPAGTVTDWPLMVRGGMALPPGLGVEGRAREGEAPLAELGDGVGDDDSLLDADHLAQATTHALGFVHHGHPREGVLRGALQADAIEGAHGHADIAAGTQLLDDLGAGDVLGLGVDDELALLVDDGIIGAPDSAHPAVDAQLRIDVIEALLLTGDGAGGALDLADAAPRTPLRAEVWHGRSPARTRWPMPDLPPPLPKPRNA